VKSRTVAAAVCSIVAIAAWMRLPGLADRPMHADEAIFAFKLGTLLETGAWSYEPGEYHGPLLHYLTGGVAWVCGARSHRDLTEPMLRAVPAFLGVLIVLSPLLLMWASGGAGPWPAAASQAAHPAAYLAASGFLAISPAMVYYNRYYIPETLLVLLTALLLAVILRYVQEPQWWLAVAAGAHAGLMFATKETAVIAAVAIAVAATFGLLRKAANWRHVLAAVATAAMVIVVLLGPKHVIESMSVYASRALGGSAHAHPWYYYFQVLGIENPVVVLAVAGAILARSRFFAIFTLGLAVVYSAIPYKTPWCALGFLYGCAILAGFAVASVSRIERRWMRAGAFCLALILGAHLAVQAYSRSRDHSADLRNPYAYAHTTPDVYTITERIEKLTRAHEAGIKMPLQVISSSNVWPLPWYLRRLPATEWRRAVTDDMRPAQVILATADVEPSLLRHLYEVMPPGQRPLYVPLFSDPVDLRPGMEVRGYVQQSLWSVAETQ
jgi:uncharacterized protein (TIGR03663 family)